MFVSGPNVTASPQQKTPLSYPHQPVRSVLFGTTHPSQPTPVHTPTTVSKFKKIRYRIKASIAHRLGQVTVEELQLWDKVAKAAPFQEIYTLLELGVNPNKPYPHPPYRAKRLLKEAFNQYNPHNVENQQQVISLLLQYGADPNPPLGKIPDFDLDSEWKQKNRWFQSQLLAYGANPTNTFMSEIVQSEEEPLYKDFLAAGAALRAPDKVFDSELMQAGLSHNEDAVKIFIKHGASLPPYTSEVQHYLNHTPHRIKKHLLAAGLDPNGMPTLLKQSIEHGGPIEWIEGLLIAGADPNPWKPKEVEAQYPNIPILLAFSHENKAAFQLLLKYGAVFPPQFLKNLLYNRQASQWFTPLLANGLDPNSKILCKSPPLQGETLNTLLFHSLENGQFKLAKALLASGANPEGRGKYGWTLMHWAAYYNDLPLLQRCVELGMDPNDHQTHDQSTPIMVAALKGSAAMMNFLLENGADPHREDIYNNTLLHYAASNPELACLERALSLGVTLTQENKQGQTALDKAIQSCRQENLKRLIQCYQEKALPIPDRSLAQAVVGIKPSASKFLLAHGADPNQLTLDGQHPLSLLLDDTSDFATRINLTEVLVKYGADTTVLSSLHQLLAALYLQQPQALLQSFLKHAHALDANAFYKIFKLVDDQGSVEQWQRFVPELLTIIDHLPPIAKTDKVINAASEAITRFYSYIHSDQNGPSVGHLERIALQNWARIGTLGLSFSRWRFDAMTRWKGVAPQEQCSLLEASGLFKPTPLRADDATYHRSFTHNDPETGLFIELRRAYISISQPELGTLVIRNSSHVFGRDLFKETAYYKPDKTYTGGEDLVNPEELSLSDGFESVLSKRLNRTIETQKEVHAKIGSLILAFEKTMERYIAWKCDFKNGLPPPGFEALLSTALKSTEHNGTASPFGKQKNLRLAWVHPTKLPVIIKALELKAPEIQAEARAFLLRRAHRSSATETYPRLIEFLSFGLSHGLELVLTPATDSAL